jgi:hypothetical protein
MSDDRREKITDELPAFDLVSAAIDLIAQAAEAMRLDGDGRHEKARELEEILTRLEQLKEHAK